jgi:hypothetical protein
MYVYQGTVNTIVGALDFIRVEKCKYYLVRLSPISCVWYSTDIRL